MENHAREKTKILPEAESLVPQVVLQEPLVISDADNKISVVQVQSKQKQLYESVSVARPHECGVCHAAFKQAGHLKQHYRRHTGERPYKCFKCDRRFTSNSSLKFHLRTTHNDARPYSCSMCDTKFSTQGSLKRHLVTHSNKRSYMCPYCQKTFKTNFSCRKHIKRHKHELAQRQLEEQKTQKEPQSLSEDKGATTALPGSITLVEDREVSFQLQMAPDFTQAFSDQFQSLSARKQKQLYESVNVARMHECGVCHAAFKKVSHLKQHYRRHTGERPYKCSKCDRRFTSNSVLKSHLHTHNDGRPYSCSMCDTKLSTQGNLKRHLVTHSNKRSYMCPYCQKTFKTNVYCRKHIKSHKHELAQRQLEEQKTQKEPQSLSEDKGATSALPGSITLVEDMEVSFQLQMAPDFTQAFSDQFQSLTAEKEKSFLLPDNATSSIVNQNLSVGTTNLGTSQTLHADETGTITLPNYSGDQILTPEIKREIEGTLNQQLFNIDMNLGLGANNLPRQMDEANTNSLNNSREQPVLNVIYEQNKNLESSSNTIFMSQFDSFDMNQIKLETDNDMDIDLKPTNSTSMSSILPRSMGINQQEEQRAAPVTTNSNVDASQITKNTHLVVISPKEKWVLMDAVAERKSIDRVDENAEKKETREYTNKCKYCPKTFRKSCDLIRHICTHTGERPYKCDHCNKSFAVKCNLNSHMKVHTGKKTFCCHVCSSMFATKGSLKIHMRLHTGSKPFKCPVCDLRFRTSGHKKVHLLKHAKQFMSLLDGTKKHSKIAAVEEAAASLEKVDNSFLDNASTTPVVINETASSQNLDSFQEACDLDNVDHMVITNQVLMETTTADTSNATVTQMINCMPPVSVQIQTQDTGAGVAEVRTSDRTMTMATTMPATTTTTVKASTQPSRKECDVCGKTFMKPYQLERHKRVHTGERPFKCEQCGKSFTQKCTLQLHQKHHTGDRPYSCPYCKHLFTQKGNLKTHLRRIHQLVILDVKKLKSGQQMLGALVQDN